MFALEASLLWGYDILELASTVLSILSISGHPFSIALDTFLWVTVTEVIVKA